MADLEIYQKALGQLGTNCYIMVNHDTNECIVFDPADGSASVLKEIFDTPEFQLKAIFLTHGHYDHMGSAKELKVMYNVPIFASKEESEKILCKAGANLSVLFDDPMTVEVDEFLNDEQQVEIIGTTLKCLLTPGHTAGGMCYYCEELQSVISGDTLFCESVGRTDFPTGSGRELERSVREKLFTLPDETKVFPGHMNMTTIKWEKENNPYF